MLAQGLQRYDASYGSSTTTLFAAKLGFPGWRDEHGPLLERLFELLFHSEADMTDFFRRLGELTVAADPGSALPLLAESSYAPERWAMQAQGWREWWQQYIALSAFPQVGAGDTAIAASLTRAEHMHAANPRYVLRNYLAQQVIEQAEAGDPTGIHELLDVLRRPYSEQPGRERFAEKRPEWARHKAGCSALSCSS